MNFATRTFPPFLKLLICLFLAAQLSAQSSLELLPEEDPETTETHQVIWETEPGVRYEAQTSTNLSQWDPVEGYPAEATSVVDALSFSVGEGSRFFRVVQYDDQAPAIAERFPDEGDFAIGRFDSITVELSDLTGVDPASISLTVGALGSFGVSAPQLSFADGVLTFDNGGDTALGDYDTTVEVSLTVADTLGFSATYDWAFLLEKEAVVAENVFVLGSVEAQRAGQQLAPEQRAIFRQVSPATGPIRMNSGAAPWTLTEVGEAYLIFSYSGSTPPSFQTGQFLANLAPGREDEVFYRKVVSTNDDAGAQEITVVTEDVSILEIVTQASFFVTPATWSQGIYRIAEDGLLVDTQTSVLLGDSFTHSVEFAESAVSFDLAGGWEFEPSLRLAMDIQGAQVEGFYCRFDGRSSIYVAPSISVSGSVEATASTAQPILKAGHIFYLGQAGPVPIWVDMDFTLNAEAGVTVDASATLSTSIERSESFYMEATYSSRNPDLSGFDYSPPTATLEVDPVTFVLEGHGHAYARLVPQVDVRLESIFGVYANIVPEVGLTGDATLLNGELETASVELYGRVDLNAGLSLIGFDAGELPSLDPVELAYFPWRYEYPEPEALTITTQPADTEMLVGRGLVLRCVAVDNLPISYRWFKDGVPLPGETAAELRIDRAKLSDAGNYSVRLRSGSGDTQEELFSEPATVTVTEPGAAPSGFSLIPAGSFEMGDSFNESGSGSDERPVHTVYVSGFYMARTETTYSRWQEVYNWAVANGYSFDNAGQGKGANHPVHSVSWYDTVKWCNAASEREGLAPVYRTSGGGVYRTGKIAPVIEYGNRGYRLPTEAEWEKAARGGLSGKRFPWGDTISHSEANYYADGDRYSYDTSPFTDLRFHPSYDDGVYPYTSPVGSFGTNGYGLYDMAGNLWEWCNDWYGSSYYSSSPGRDPAGPILGTYRVSRGGGWSHLAFNCRSAYRNRLNPVNRFISIGFRLALSQ